MGLAPGLANPPTPWQRGVTQNPNARSQTRQEVLDKSREMFSTNYDANATTVDFKESDVETLSENLDVRLIELAKQEAKTSLSHILIDKKTNKNKNLHRLKDLDYAILDLGHNFFAKDLAKHAESFGAKVNKQVAPVLEQMVQIESLPDTESQVTQNKRNRALDNLRQEALKIISDAKGKYTPKAQKASKKALGKVEKRIKKNKKKDKKEITFQSQFIRNHNAFKLIDRDPNRLNIGTARLLNNQQASLKSLIAVPVENANSEQGSLSTDAASATGSTHPDSGTEDR